MTPTYFAALFGLLSVWASGTRMIGVFTAACLFGGSAALTLDLAGGAPITPAAFCLLALAWWAFRLVGVNKLFGYAVDASSGLWLSLLCLWSLLSAALVPRLLQGKVLVLAIVRSESQATLVLKPLEPTGGNLTQSAYAIGGLCVFLCFVAFLSRDPGMRLFVRAIYALTALNILAALVNLAELASGMSGVMEIVRNAGYAIFDGGEIGGLFRISGTFAETSAFSAFTLPLFAFTLSLWRNGGYGAIPGYLSLMSFGLLVFSTSTTAYAGLIVLLVVSTLTNTWKIASGRESFRLGPVAIALWIVLAAGCLFLLLFPSKFAVLADFFQTALFRKLDSGSGAARQYWNAQAWNNFIDTRGIGVGLGSAQAASFPLVLLSNVGVVGATLFLTFVAAVINASGKAKDPVSAPIFQAAAFAMVASLVASCISGTVFDIGMIFYVFAAAASSAGRDEARGRAGLTYA